MTNLLNRALNFSILPLKLNITEVLMEFNRFSRASIWHEYWHGRDRDEEYKLPIFKTQKYNLPKNHITPAGLKVFLSSVKSEIMDHKNRNEEKCNLPPEEISALENL